MSIIEYNKTLRAKFSLQRKSY